MYTTLFLRLIILSVLTPVRVSHPTALRSAGTPKKKGSLGGKKKAGDKKAAEKVRPPSPHSRAALSAVGEKDVGTEGGDLREGSGPPRRRGPVPPTGFYPTPARPTPSPIFPSPPAAR